MFSILLEIQHHHFDYSHLSHDILINIENTQTPIFDNDSASFTEISHSNAIIQTPDPPFFAHFEAFENFYENCMNFI